MPFFLKVMAMAMEKPSHLRNTQLVGACSLSLVHLCDSKSVERGICKFKHSKVESE